MGNTPGNTPAHSLLEDDMQPQTPDRNRHPLNGQFFEHPGISDIGDTLRLDDTIGNGPTTQPQESDPESGEKTVIQDPIGTDPVSQMSVEQWLESLRRNDRTFYNMMAMEVWSIAKSMDTIIPGFWSKFMANRQLAVQTFVGQRRTEKGPGLRLEDLGDPTAPSTPQPDGNPDLN
jgi:hypothetical protein